MKKRLLGILMAVMLLVGAIPVCAAYTPDANAQKAFRLLASHCRLEGVRDGNHYRYSETRGDSSTQWLRYDLDYDASEKTFSILLRTHNLGSDNWLEQIVVDQNAPSPLTLNFGAENGPEMKVFGETYLTKSIVPELYKPLPFDFDALHYVDQYGNTKYYTTPELYEQAEVWNGGCCKILTDYLDELLAPDGLTWRDLAADTKPPVRPPISGVTVEDFEDVPNGHYAYPAISWARKTGITQGTSAKRFSPNATCTRGQVVTFLWRAHGCPQPKSSVNPFSDVPAGAYYYDAVLWAVEQRITEGVSRTRFDPNAGCTRGQVVTFLYRDQNGYVPESAENVFADVKPGTYYYEPVLWAFSFGITVGETPNSFAPGKVCTRAQIVTFLFRTYGSTWPDFA